MNYYEKKTAVIHCYTVKNKKNDNVYLFFGDEPKYDWDNDIWYNKNNGRGILIGVADDNNFSDFNSNQPALETELVVHIPINPFTEPELYFEAMCGSGEAAKRKARKLAEKYGFKVTDENAERKAQEEKAEEERIRRINSIPPRGRGDGIVYPGMNPSNTTIRDIIGKDQGDYTIGDIRLHQELEEQGFY